MRYVVQVSVPVNVVVDVSSEEKALAWAVDRAIPEHNPRRRDAVMYPYDFAEIVESDADPLPVGMSRLVGKDGPIVPPLPERP